MEKVLVVNSGSSSIKYQLFRCDDWSALATGAVTRIGEEGAEVKSEWLDGEGTRHASRVSAPIHLAWREPVRGRAHLVGASAGACAGPTSSSKNVARLADNCRRHWETEFMVMVLTSAVEAAR